MLFRSELRMTLKFAVNIECNVYITKSTTKDGFHAKFCEDRWFCHLVVCQNCNFAHESHVVLLIVCLFFPQCWQIFEEWFSMDSRWRSATPCRFWRNVKVVNVVVVLLTINFFRTGDLQLWRWILLNLFVDM